MNPFSQFEKSDEDYEIPPFINQIKFNELIKQENYQDAKIQQFDNFINNDISIILNLEYLGIQNLNERVLIIKENDRILDVKSKIQKQVLKDYNVEFELILNEYILSRNNSTVKEEQIKNNSIIMVIIKIKNYLPIHIQTNTGKTTVMDFDYSYPQKVINLKVAYQYKEGIPPDQTRLIYNGKQFDDNQYLIKYLRNQDVEEKFKIHLLLKLAGGMQLFIKMPTQNQIIVTLELSTSIDEIKKLIEDRTGLSIYEQRLIFKGVVLQEGKTLSYYNMKAEDMIHVILISNDQEDNNVSFFFEYPNRNMLLQLMIDKNLQVSYLKEELRLQTKEDFFLLIYKNQVVDESWDSQLIKIFEPDSTFIVVNQDWEYKGIQLTMNLSDLTIQGIKDLQKSLNFLPSQLQLNQFITQCMEIIPHKKEGLDIYQKCPIENILAIKIWTSNLVYRQINIDLQNGFYDKWKVFLKTLLAGLKHCPYFCGTGYRGIKNYKNLEQYQQGKQLQWCQVSGLSKLEEIANKFTNTEGTFFEVKLLTAKDISSISQFPDEEEVLLQPFTCFMVERTQVNHNSPLIIKLKEIPYPKSIDNVILWVDDNPKNNHIFIQDLELENPEISIIYCLSTAEAVNIINFYRVIVTKVIKQFRVVTDMVRLENNKMNYYAGIDLIEILYKQFQFQNQILVYCSDEKNAQKNLIQRGVQGNYQVTNSPQKLKQFIRFK
ncbi:unnamed protein product [Paramecium sonneborni]|uniref:NAD(P)(+)--arginine ADP-ribosyltransferase n=1 Tax=Paramecium sonneborni TaxID=65129 RepID=A0A8S1P5E5_9CILI|nr:unnamed protein product [Paramecium sonneborni]